MPLRFGNATTKQMSKKCSAYDRPVLLRNVKNPQAGQVFVIAPSTSTPALGSLNIKKGEPLPNHARLVMATENYDLGRREFVCIAINGMSGDPIVGQICVASEMRNWIAIPLPPDYPVSFDTVK